MLWTRRLRKSSNRMRKCSYWVKKSPSTMERTCLLEARQAWLSWHLNQIQGHQRIAGSVRWKEGHRQSNYRIWFCRSYSRSSVSGLTSCGTLRFPPHLLPRRCVSWYYNLSASLWPSISPCKQSTKSSTPQPKHITCPVESSHVTSHFEGLTASPPALPLNILKITQVGMVAYRAWR